MKQIKNRSRLQSKRDKITQSPDLPDWIFPGAIAVVIMFLISDVFNNRPKIKINNLQAIELNRDLASQNQLKAQREAPRYGLQDVVVPEAQEQVIINLRDNGHQDGDRVTLIVNERVITANHYLLNKGSSIPVSIRPGVNLVKIYGNKDGANNGLGISLAADVSGQGNATSSLFPENATATFNIVRP